MGICGVCKNKKKRVARAGMLHKPYQALATQEMKAAHKAARAKKSAADNVRAGVVSTSSCFFFVLTLFAGILEDGERQGVPTEG